MIPVFFTVPEAFIGMNCCCVSEKMELYRDGRAISTPGQTSLAACTSVVTNAKGTPMMKSILKFLWYPVFILTFSYCQDNDTDGGFVKRIKFSGPRIGIVHYSAHFGDILERAFDVPPTLTVIGWENELQFKQNRGLIGTTKLIWLFAGFEQGVFLPQFHWQIGIITNKHLEFGLGPYLSFTGPALAVSLEKTLGKGPLVYPVKAGIAFQEKDYFITLLLGFEAAK
jgi:hypothetical protein